MNNIFDMGGLQGFGLISPELNDDVFHHEWEKRVLAMQLATLAQNLYLLDELRHSIEVLHPKDYMSMDYYQRWLYQLEYFMENKGLLTKEEIDNRVKEIETGQYTLDWNKDEDKTLGNAIKQLLVQGASASREIDRTPRFSAGDRVFACKMHPLGHTRLPQYARGKMGKIECYHGCQVFPDSNAHGGGESPEPLYTVRFRATELWGESAGINDYVYLDLFEPYLKKVPGGNSP